MSWFGGNEKKRKRKAINIMMCMLGGFVLGCVGIGGGTSVINTAYATEENKTFVPSEVPAPEFSAEAGFYEEAFELVLTAPEGTEIYYTLDGSVPGPENATSLQYVDPIAVELCDSVKGRDLLTATVVRAVAVNADGTSSDVITHTYFVANRMLKRYDVPVVSLVADPEDLYGKETGIIANPEEKGRDWERPAHFEYFVPEGTREISMNVGIRINGGYSRRFEMKSFRVYARSEYDTQKNIKYDFFSGGLIPAVEKNGEQKTIEKFKRILLRAGGNESDAWETTFFRDILTQSLMVGTSLDLQAYQPAVLYLNGEFYGILNIRERLDERYLASHYNCGEDEVVIYGFEYDKDSDGQVILPPEGEPVFEVAVEEGPEEEKAFFDEAYAFVTQNDMSDPALYAKAQEYFDMENFIDYLCVQMYCGNTDWPHNNCEAWRYVGEPSEEYGLDGKIRWLLFDTDFGFGLYGHPVEEQIIDSMVADQRGEQPYRDVLTCLFRSFLKNEGFKKQFKTRFLELLETNFLPKNVLANVEVLEEIYRPLVAEKYLKYGERHDINHNMAVVRDYASARANVIKRCLDWVLDEELHENAVSSPLLKTNQKIVLGVLVAVIVAVAAFLIARKKKEKNY